MDKIIKLEKELIQLRNIVKLLMTQLEKQLPDYRNLKAEIKELNSNLEWVSGE